MAVQVKLGRCEKVKYYGRRELNPALKENERYYGHKFYWYTCPECNEKPHPRGTIYHLTKNSQEGQ